jgi:hypothetical protein
MQLDGVESPRPRPGALRVDDLGVYEMHGGHTLARHVYTRAGDEVRRIETEGVAAAGRFLNRATAQRCVYEAVNRRAGEIRAWLLGRHRHAPFTFVEDMGRVVGHSLTYADVERGSRVPEQVTGVRLVLRRNRQLRGGFTVVTAYPTRPLHLRRDRHPAGEAA